MRQFARYRIGDSPTICHSAAEVFVVHGGNGTARFLALLNKLRERLHEQSFGEAIGDRGGSARRNLRFCCSELGNRGAPVSAVCVERPDMDDQWK